MSLRPTPTATTTLSRHLRNRPKTRSRNRASGGSPAKTGWAVGSGPGAAAIELQIGE
jgi:hypothetical protein